VLARPPGCLRPRLDFRHDRVNVVVRIDRPLDVFRRVFPFAIDPSMADRLVGRDHHQSRAVAPRQVDRELDRFGCRVGAVGADGDCLNHGVDGMPTRPDRHQPDG